MAFPATAAPTVSTQAANTTSHTVSVPAHDTGDILLMFFGADGFPPSNDMRVTAIGALNGAAWTFYNSGGTGGLGQTIATPSATFAWVRATSAAGSPVNVTVTTSNSEMSATHVYKITGAHTTTDPEYAFGQGSGGTVNYNPPTLNPAGWDVEDTLWLFFTIADSNSGTTTFATTPSGWAVVTHYGASDVKLLSGRQESAAASNMPGTGDLSEAEQTISFTVAVRPADAAAAPTVTAGASPSSVSVGGTITLDGTLISDGGDPSITYEWTHLSGAGVATFADASLIDTTVTCDTADSHTFRLTATNSNGAGSADTSPVAVGVTVSVSQVHFRIRDDDAQSGNADAGWAAALDTNASIDMETPFGVRFEVEETGGASTGSVAYKLQFNRNAAGWSDVGTEENINELDSSVGQVACGLSFGATDGTATTNVLVGAAAAFVPGSIETGGSGLSAVDAQTAAVTLNSQHTEFEWRLRIHHFSDGPTIVSVGDTIQLRVVESDGTPLDAYDATPTVTVGPSVGIIGGTMVESPNRVGPFEDGNGGLYAVMEYALTTNQLLLAKSADGGNTWIEAQPTGRPPTNINDIESGDARLVGDTLHIAIQGPSTDSVYYITYDVSSHPSTPDTWQITDELVTATGNPLHQNAAIEVRGDGSVVVAYAEVDTQDHVAYRIRAPGGGWGTPVIINQGDGNTYHHIVSCMEPGTDTIWFFYWRLDGTIWYRTLSSADALSGETQLETGLSTAGAHVNPTMPPLAYETGGSQCVLVVWKAADNTLRSVQFTDGVAGTEQAATTVAVEYSEGTSHQPIAGFALVGTTAHLFYADAVWDPYYRSRDHDGTWSAVVPVTADTPVHWVRPEPVTGGVGVYYDAGSDGGTGFGRYLLHSLGVSAAFQVATLALSAQDASVTPGATAETFQVATVALSAQDASVTPGATAETFQVVTVALSAQDASATAGVQVTRPSGDLHVGAGWENEVAATTNLWQSIDEEAPSDVDWIRSPNSPSGSFTDVLLGTSVIQNPADVTGHLPQYRYGKAIVSGSPTIDFTLEIYRYEDYTDEVSPGPVVATRVHSDIPAAPVTVDSVELTGGEHANVIYPFTPVYRFIFTQV